MKKYSFFAISFALTLLLSSCASTSSLEPKKENSEESTTQSAGESSAESAELSSNQTNDLEKNSPAEEDEISEKVTDEAKLDKKSDKAPTTDEKSKVNEYQIFEEPEIQVHDLIEIDAKTEEKKEEPELVKEESNIKKEEPESKNQTQIEESLPQALSLNQDEKTAEGDSEVKQAKTDNEAEEGLLNQENELPLPSRSVKVNINQYLDVTYPGTGWVYIGESEKAPLFNYFGRKLGTSDTTFALRAKKAGNTMLHFYKNDALTGEYIDDYLEVEVINQKSTGRVKAPSYADIVPSRPQRRIQRENPILPEAEAQVTPEKTTVQSQETEKTESSAKENQEEQKNKEITPNNSSSDTSEEVKTHESDIKTVIQNTVPTSSQTLQETANEENDNNEITAEPVITEENQIFEIDESLLEKAKKDFEAKNYELALSEAQQYYNGAETRLDEALYLLGQIWEADSPVKNIRSSLDSYDMIIKRYPKSTLWQKAKNRSIYLKRFYIDIR